MKKLNLLFTSLILLCALLAPAHAAEADLKADLAKFQGKWKGTLTVDDSVSDWTMDIKANKATLSIRNKDGNEVFKGECDFKLEQAGKFRAFTYFNLKHLAGSQEGETELTGGKTRSSLYKFEDSATFSTIGGFREDDDGPQWLIRWEKTK